MYECVKGVQDYTIFYQKVPKSSKTINICIEKQYALHLGCDQCTREIIRSSLDIDSPDVLNQKIMQLILPLVNSLFNLKSIPILKLTQKKFVYFSAFIMDKKMGIDIETMRGTIYADESISDLHSITNMSKIFYD